VRGEDYTINVTSKLSVRRAASPRWKTRRQPQRGEEGRGQADERGSAGGEMRPLSNRFGELLRG
jgi:hypothetical protein